jgi:hypothetical protein
MFSATQLFFDVRGARIGPIFLSVVHFIVNYLFIFQTAVYRMSLVLSIQGLANK